MSRNKSKAGRDELLKRLQEELKLPTKKQTTLVMEAFIRALEATLLNNLQTDEFSLKLKSLGKFTVHHRPEMRRKVPFTGKVAFTKEKRKVKFTVLGQLRKRENADEINKKTFPVTKIVSI